MDISIKLTPHFKRDYKRLLKKYKSLEDDVEALIESLLQNPLQGADLGNNLHKVRLAIASKGKGKSGGARVITHVLLEVESGTIRFLTIYDKSERSTISDKELKTLISENDIA